MSGADFRDTLLAKALAEADHVVIDLDGSYGYSSTFLREVFAGLIHKGMLTYDEVPKRLSVKADEAPICSYEAMEWMREATTGEDKKWWNRAGQAIP